MSTKLVSRRERGPINVHEDDEHSLTKKEIDELVNLAQLENHKYGIEYQNWLTLESGNFYFGPFCGIIQTPSVTIELLPKIVHKRSEDTLGLLIKLLQINGELNFTNISDYGTRVRGQNIHLLDLFIQDFCKQILNMIARGIIFRYEDKVENLNKVRGTIQFAENLRINAFCQSHIVCKFDEYAIDNLFNRILKFVLHLLHKKARSVNSRSIVLSALHRFDQVTDQPYDLSDFNALNFDRTNCQWKNTFDQARRLLRGHYPDVRIPKITRDSDTYGLTFLFSMQRLFENVLGRRIKRNYRFRVQLRKQEEYLAIDIDTKKHYFGLQPDIIVYNEKNEVVAILDAKWKDLALESRRVGVLNADIYQMNAYADAYKCKNLALLYPASSDYQAGRVVKRLELNSPLNPKPVLHVVAIDIYDLAFGNGPLKGLETVLS